MYCRTGTVSFALALALSSSGCDDPSLHAAEGSADPDAVVEDAVQDDEVPTDAAESEDDAPEDVPEGPQTLFDGLDPEEIIGGVVWDSDRDVMVAGPTDLCTGTLLRNDVVLTGKHCVSTDGTVDGPWLDPSDMTVTQDGPGASLGAQRSVTEIVRNPGMDVAVMRLASPFSIDGSTLGESTQILATPQSEVVGQVVLCQGFGRDTCDSGAGTLRAGLVELASSNAGLLTYHPWSGLDWIQWAGDSGGSCRYGALSSASLQKVLGVASFGACGTQAIEIGPDLYRDWAVGEMNAWAGLEFNDGFWWPYFYEVDVPPGMISGPPAWIRTGGVLTENTNAYTNTPFSEGTRYINRREVASDSIVHVTVSSADNDAAGLVLRYRDSTHYYRLSFDEQRRTARIVRRSGSNWTVIAERTDFDIDWSSSPRISFYASGAVLVGMVDGNLVLGGVDDIDGYTAGRAGMYTWGLTGATFDDFQIERI